MQHLQYITVSRYAKKRILIETLWSKHFQLYPGMQLRNQKLLHYCSAFTDRISFDTKDYKANSFAIYKIAFFIPTTSWFKSKHEPRRKREFTSSSRKTMSRTKCAYFYVKIVDKVTRSIPFFVSYFLSLFFFSFFGSSITYLSEFHRFISCVEKFLQTKMRK